MTKKELRAAYVELRTSYEQGELYTNEYALHIDTLLANYFNMPLLESPEDVD